MLKLDWATHGATAYACRNWHYSKTVPAGKTIKIGVYEGPDDQHLQFIGVVIFSRGATPEIGSPYGLTQSEVCELTRVALNTHVAPVSKILSLALRFLRTNSPGLRLVVSYADADQNHHGGIYQATNWVYTGLMNVGSMGAFVVCGKKVHPRSIGAAGGTQSLEWVRANLDPRATVFYTTGKHKYLQPLDEPMRQQIKPLSLPYPKRAEVPANV